MKGMVGNVSSQSQRGVQTNMATYRNSDNTSGVAYAWMVITLFTILCGILISWYGAGVINALLAGPNGDNSVGINHDIAAGYQSAQSRNAIQFNVDFSQNLPIMIVLSVLVFAVARAIVVKRVP